ncbi:MAG TPA: acyltransferase, partial [Brevibacterium sp.]|nr:acyltransferase [Brevibacterium sp.]
ATQVYVADLGIPGFTQSWSIATELAFYAVLPLIVLALRPARRRDLALPMKILVVLAVVGVIASGVIGGGVIGSEPLYERWLPARLTNFVLGMILAEALARPDDRVSLWISRLGASPGACLGLAASAYLLATTPIAGALTLGGVGGEFDHAVKMVLSCVVALGLMVPLLWSEPNTFRTVLTHPASRWLGKVSYGVFLWHLAVFEGLYAVSGLALFAGGMLPLLAVGVPLSLLLAALSYSLVEEPASRWVARRLRRGREEQESASRSRATAR